VNKLPVIGSSAATTAFCAAKLEGPGGHLWVDGNAKITASNGTYLEPRPNAFSLEAQAVVNREWSDDITSGDMFVMPPEVHCPGSTSVCRSSCYVNGLESAVPDTYALYRHNSKMIRQILAGPEVGFWAMTLANWIKEHASGGFRWHVSGDVFSTDYAAFIARVCSLSVDVDHWIYSRSFDLLRPLLDVENLCLNISTDVENYEAGRAFVEAASMACPLTTIRLCYLTSDGAVPDDLPHGSVIFPDYALRGARGQTPAEQRASSAWYQGLPSNYRSMTCPVDFHGKSEELRCGPCRKCMLPAERT